MVACCVNVYIIVRHELNGVLHLNSLISCWVGKMTKHKLLKADFSFFTQNRMILEFSC